MNEPIISQVMTSAPYTIGHKQTLVAAHRMMNQHNIRHLPVLDGGKLVGVLTKRDLHFLETIKGVDPEQVLVEEAMSQDVYAVGQKSSVRKVAAEMAAHKYGCAVVTDKDHVVGIFTTVDALKVLSDLLTELRPFT